MPDVVLGSKTLGYNPATRKAAFGNGTDAFTALPRAFGIEPAPNDGYIYGRKMGEWVRISVPDEPSPAVYQDAYISPDTTIGYDREAHVTKIGLIGLPWSSSPRIGMPEAPMDGGLYLAVGQEWVKIDETNSDITVLWHNPEIAEGQVIDIVSGQEMDPYSVFGTYIRNEVQDNMPNPSDITSVVWSAVNLPDGLTLGESTGIISGTPTTPGTYTTNVTVTTNWGTDTKAIGIIVAVPDSWKPDIASGQVLYLTAGEEMEPYKITGTNIDLTPQELVPITTPLLTPDEDFICYLPFDDYPNLDLARKIQWENHGCKLITVGEGEHNKRLSFENGGYMIGNGRFTLIDVEHGGLIHHDTGQGYGLYDINEGFTLSCEPHRDPDVPLDANTEYQGLYLCLYNDDLSNFIAIANGRRDPIADYIPELDRPHGSNYRNEITGTNTNAVAPVIHITGANTNGARSWSKYPNNGDVIQTYGLYTGFTQNMDSFTDPMGKTSLFCAPGGASTRWVDYGQHGPVITDNFGFVRTQSNGYEDNDNDLLESDWSITLSPTSLLGYKYIEFTHIAINYNPRYPNARFSGWMGPVVLKKTYRNRSLIQTA